MDQENEYNDSHYHHEEEDNHPIPMDVGKPLANADLENASQLALLFILKWQPLVPVLQKPFRNELNSLLGIVGQAVVKSTFSKIIYTLEKREADETNKPNPDTPTGS